MIHRPVLSHICLLDHCFCRRRRIPSGKGEEVVVPSLEDMFAFEMEFEDAEEYVSAFFILRRGEHNESLV